MARPLLYYITDRSIFPGDERTQRSHLLDKIAEAAGHGVDYIQLREKDLSARDLEMLACEAVRIVRNTQTQKTRAANINTALLINSRTDVALAARADGVHLRAEDIAPEDVRSAWRSRFFGAGISAFEGLPSNPLIAVSCHSPEDVMRGGASHADFAVFAPVFEKRNVKETQPTGLVALREACRAHIPIFALGGLTIDNAHLCLEAGAAGIAGIRLFQENDIGLVVKALRK